MKQPRDQRLFAAGIVFAAGSGVHVIDHLRRGQGSVSNILYTLGNVGLVIQVITVVLIVTRHRLAPIVSTAAGFSLAFAFTAVHWLPHWSSISDPVWRIRSATWFSYIASSAEIIGALAIGVAGLAAYRAPLTRPRPDTSEAAASR